MIAGQFCYPHHSGCITIMIYCESANGNRDTVRLRSDNGRLLYRQGKQWAIRETIQAMSLIGLLRYSCVEFSN